MRLIRAKDYADVSRKAANIIAAQVQLKPDCVLGLATGSSPIGTYKELIAKYEAGGVGGKHGGGQHTGLHAAGGNNGQRHSHGTLTNTGNVLNCQNTLILHSNLLTFECI